MAHWEHRPEPRWKEFKFSQPYAKGLKRLREEVLAKTDFDPATLWQWGTMQAMAVIEVLKACERASAPRGREVVCRGAAASGASISGGRCWPGKTKPADIQRGGVRQSSTPTVINRIAYASLEAAEDRQRGAGRASTFCGARTRTTTRLSTAACSATSCRG